MLQEIINKLSKIPESEFKLLNSPKESLKEELSIILSKLDLVTREKFEVQAKVLAKAIIRIKELEQELDELKSKDL